jgi:hypothetical protein
MRTVVLVVALAAILGLAALTVYAAVSGGVDVLTLVSLLIIALFGFGIVGALLHPPDEP